MQVYGDAWEWVWDSPPIDYQCKYIPEHKLVKICLSVSTSVFIHNAQTKGTQHKSKMKFRVLLDGCPSCKLTALYDFNCSRKDFHAMSGQTDRQTDRQTDGNIEPYNFSRIDLAVKIGTIKKSMDAIHVFM